MSMCLCVCFVCLFVCALIRKMLLNHSNVVPFLMNIKHT